MRHLISDADGLIYKIAFPSQHAINWAEINQPELWTLHADENEAWFRLARAIDDLKARFKADAYTLCLSDSTNFRHRLLPTYKGNRADTLKPLLHSRLRDRALSELPTCLVTDFEADDLLGIFAHNLALSGEAPLIVTDDKDLLTVPKPQVHFAGSERDIVCPTQVEADRWHMRQTLTGDAVDNYAGCPGFGPKSADKVLTKFDGDVPKFWEEVVVPAYVKRGLTAEDALVQARCAYILRSYDDVPGKWTPQVHPKE